MTEKLYLNEAYLKECDARVNKVTDRGIILDRTVFYARGGGQPGDSGTISFGDRVVHIDDTIKEGDDVLHLTEDISGITEGDFCKCTLNWDLRYQYMRYHSAIHLMDGIFNNMPVKTGLITGSQIYADRARVDFSVENFSQDIVLELIEMVNSAVEEGHNISVKYLPSEEALKIPNLARTEPGRELIKRLPVVRIVNIEGIDAQADGGTHVNNTREIGKLSLNRIENKGKKNKRVYFTVD